MKSFAYNKSIQCSLKRQVIDSLTYDFDYMISFDSSWIQIPGIHNYVRFESCSLEANFTSDRDLDSESRESFSI